MAIHVIDFDEVIFPFNENAFLFISQRLGRENTLKDYPQHKIFDYHVFTNFFNISDEQVFSLFTEFMYSPKHLNAPPIPGSINGLRELISRGEQPIIGTARFDLEKQSIIDYFKKHAPDLSDKIQVYTLGQGASKVEFATKMGAKSLVDDHPKNLNLNGYAYVIDGYIFTTKWNKHLKDYELPKGVKRINNWKDLLNKI